MNAVTDRQTEWMGRLDLGSGKSMASPVNGHAGGGWPRMTLLIHAEPLDRPRLNPCSPRVKEARGNLPHTEGLCTDTVAVRRFIRSTMIYSAKAGVKDSPR